jgi:hypothetical protein
MNEELDPQLLALFSQTREPLNDAQFLAATLTRIERQLRLQLIVRTATVTAAVIVAALLLPWLLDNTARAIGALWSSTQFPVGFAAGPWIWIASAPIGVYMVIRSVWSRG